MTKNLTLLRLALIVIFLVHSIAGMFNNGINNFGDYLNTAGFNPVGIPLAWLIKLSHIAFAYSLITNKYLKITAITTLLILITGIITIHIKSGWFVVGGGSGGVEFNFLLIFCILNILYPKTLSKAV